MIYLGNGLARQVQEPTARPLIGVALRQPGEEHQAERAPLLGCLCRRCVTHHLVPVLIVTGGGGGGGSGSRRR